MINRDHFNFKRYIKIGKVIPVRKVRIDNRNGFFSCVHDVFISNQGEYKYPTLISDRKGYISILELAKIMDLSYNSIKAYWLRAGRSLYKCEKLKYLLMTDVILWMINDDRRFNLLAVTDDELRRIAEGVGVCAEAFRREPQRFFNE